MARPAASIAVLCAAAALAAGCGTSPPAHFYTLSATAAPPAASAPAATAKLLVAVGPVTVPSVVDRPEFVVSRGANRLELDEFNRWGSPLQDDLARVIAENLVTILGTPRVVLFPQKLATDPDYRVAVEIRSFESVPGTGATMDAVWTIRRSRDGKTETGRTSARESVADGSYEALAAAHSRAAARLSLDIANAIRALQGGGA